LKHGANPSRHGRIPKRLLIAAVVLTSTGSPALSQGPSAIAVSEEFRVGYQYHVNCRVNIKGELVLPPEKGQTQPTRVPVAGKSVIKYDERVLELKAATVDRTVRYYHQMDFERQAGKDDQRGSLRKEVRRLVILRHKQYEVPFCPHGPLLWEEIDMVRTDVFTPALKGLLPVARVRPGDSWAADPSAVEELTDLEKITDGRLTCVFKELTTPVSGGQFARIAFQGKIAGIGEDGPARHEIEGYLLFALATNHLSYLTMQGTHHLLDKEGKPTGGRVEGTFVLTRDLTPLSAELADTALKGLKLQPDNENTLLWFVNPEVGVSFLYPRHWHIEGVNSQKRQIGLDEKRGSGMLITIDAPQNAPSIARLQQEARTDLVKQNTKILKLETPRAVAPAIDSFGIDAEIAGRRVYLQYFLVRQKTGYAVVTANLQLPDMVALQKDLDRIVRSLQVTPPAK
jgi:hypothetical protein